MDGQQSLASAIKADYRAVLDLDLLRPRGVRRYLDALTQPGFLAVVIYRIAHAADSRGILPVSRLLLLLNLMLFGVEIHPRAMAGPGFVLPHPQGVAVAAGVRMGAHVQLFKGVSIGAAGFKDVTKDGFPTIGDRCKIFDGAKLFGPIEIGSDCLVGSGVILTESVPNNSVVLLEKNHSIVERRSQASDKRDSA